MGLRAAHGPTYAAPWRPVLRDPCEGRSGLAGGTAVVPRKRCTPFFAIIAGMVSMLLTLLAQS